VQITDYLDVNGETPFGSLIDSSLAIRTDCRNSAISGPGLTVLLLQLFQWFFPDHFSQETRIFMAIFSLEYLDCRKSPVFDMESVFWILVYVLLSRTFALNPEACEDDREMLELLLPEDTMRLSADVSRKSRILLSFQISRPIDADSCLFPYKDLLHALVQKVIAYYGLAIQHRKQKTWFKEGEEDTVVDEFIDETQKFYRMLGQVESTVPDGAKETNTPGDLVVIHE
jgi:hypothetical protein